MVKKHFLDLKVPPVAVFLVIAYLMWFAANEIPSAGIGIPAGKYLAFAIASAGGIIAVAGIVSFLRARTTIDPMRPDKAASLVTDGVNRFSRNPMYLSLLMVLLAWAFKLANIAAFVVVPLFVLYMNQFQIAPEERALSSIFGGHYEEYCRRVRRWL